MLDRRDEDGIARRRWRQTFWTIGLSLAACCCLPTYLFFGAIAGWPMPENKAALLREKTGLVLPDTADVCFFSHASWIDESVTLGFDVPENDAKGFLRQRPLASQDWSRGAELEKSDMAPILPNGEKPAPPYRATHGPINMIVEEKGREDWTIWISF